jgi:hypothetical protein
MPYSAEISRSNPTCLVFLIDQSGSMTDPFGSGEGAVRKADGVADAINRLLQNLCVKCAKEEGVRDYFHVAVIGYGEVVGPAFGGALAGRDVLPISGVAANPARVETRTKKVPDGAGGLVDQTVKFPIWFEPKAQGGTPMCEALGRAAATVSSWFSRCPKCFPPIVINITDGESTDGNPTGAADKVRAVTSDDGACLLFNLHLSSHRSTPVEYPSDESRLPDEYARILFRMSSPLPAHMLAAARQDNPAVAEGARGFAFNADLTSTIKFLDIGTRPANLR